MAAAAAHKRQKERQERERERARETGVGIWGPLKPRKVKRGMGGVALARFEKGEYVTLGGVAFCKP